MNHGEARRLLPAILDRTLPPPIEAGVREHVDACTRCGRHLAELEAVEALLLQLPSSLVPLEAAPGADARLANLARWSPEPPPTWAERIGVSALGAFAAAAMLAMVLSTAGWIPPLESPSRTVTLAAVLPEARLLPTGVR